MRRSNLWKAVGPGLVYAGAAIGVSHLVQATKAGAGYGFSLWWVVLLACVTKYTFMEAGPRYAAATGESLVQAYRKLGPWALALYLLATIGTMFTIQAAVTLVTAAFAGSLVQQFTGFTFSHDPGVNAFVWCLTVQAVVFVTLLVGRYSLLDLLMKIIVTVLSISTVVAAVWSGANATPAPLEFMPPSLASMTAVLFIVSLIGWMPTPIDCSVWQSLWTLGRTEQTLYIPTLREARIDFNIGYLTASILAFFFLALGAFVMYGHGDSFPDAAVPFANKLIAMYRDALGHWATPFITVAAFTAMLSTTLTVTDAYPRLWRHLTEVITPAEQREHESWVIYLIYLLGINALAMLIIGIVALGGYKGFFAFLVNLATALSVLTAPILAYLNHRVMTADFTPAEARPGRLHLAVSYASFACLIAFCVLYVVALV